MRRRGGDPRTAVEHYAAGARPSSGAVRSTTSATTASPATRRHGSTSSSSARTRDSSTPSSRCGAHAEVVVDLDRARARASAARTLPRAADPRPVPLRTAGRRAARLPRRAQRPRRGARRRSRAPSCRRSSAPCSPRIPRSTRPAATPDAGDRARRRRRSPAPGRLPARRTRPSSSPSLAASTSTPPERATAVSRCRRRARHRQDPPRRGADRDRGRAGHDRRVGPLLRRPRRARVLAVDPDRQRSAGPLRPRRGRAPPSVPTPPSWRRSRPRSRSWSADLEPPPPLDPESARFRLYQAVSGFMRRLARTQPLVLVVDDLHWADAPSLGPRHLPRLRDRRCGRPR